jgi:hypothetical protein
MKRFIKDTIEIIRAFELPLVIYGGMIIIALL